MGSKQKISNRKKSLKTQQQESSVFSETENVHMTVSSKLFNKKRGYFCCLAFEFEETFS